MPEVQESVLGQAETAEAIKAKQCRGCRQVLPVTAYYKDKNFSDGLNSRCKQCGKEYANQHMDRRRERRRAWYAKNHADALAYQRNWNDVNREKKRDYGRAHDAAHPECADRWKLRRILHPEKLRAKDAVNNAIKAGNLLKPKYCEDCGLEKLLHGHHPDYSKLLVVDWLCAHCHGRRHWKQPLSSGWVAAV